MDIASQFIKIVFRIFLGETKDEKDFRKAYELAIKQYQNGLRYNQQIDLKKALEALSRAPMTGAQSPQDKLKRHQLYVQIHVKMCELDLITVSGEIEQLEALVESILATDSLDQLKENAAQYALECKQAEKDLEDLMGRTAQKNDEKVIAGLKAKMKSCESNAVQVQDKIFVIQSNRKKKIALYEAAIEKMAQSIAEGMQGISQIRNIPDLPKDEALRTEQWLHRYFDALKDYESAIQTMRDQIAEVEAS